MQETRMFKAIYSWKPISRRPIGRPKIRWEDGIRKDIQKLKVPNWKNLVQIEEDGRNLLRRPKLCIKSCGAIIIRRYKKVEVILYVWCTIMLELLPTLKSNRF
jgi:hypothetical protein